MAHKELRENAWIAALAGLAFLWIVLDNIGWPAGGLQGLLTGGLHSYGFGTRVSQIPFVADDFGVAFTITAALFAVAIGFRQTLGESFQGTWLLWWRLPARRSQLLHAKLLTGALLYLLPAALPILLFAAWAAVPGTHPSPFYWSMTLPVWAAWFCMTLLYLGAFLSGLRPARWFGSRLLPLVAAGVPLFLLQVANSPWWLVAAVVAALDALWLVCIRQVAAERDYS